MKSVVIRKLSEGTHRALKKRAERHGRSTEAEIRAILEDAVHPSDKLGMGSRLAALGRHLGGVEIVVDRREHPAVPMTFE